MVPPVVMVLLFWEGSVPELGFGLPLLARVVEEERLAEEEGVAVGILGVSDLVIACTPWKVPARTR